MSLQQAWKEWLMVAAPVLRFNWKLMKKARCQGLLIKSTRVTVCHWIPAKYLLQKPTNSSSRCSVSAPATHMLEPLAQNRKLEGHGQGKEEPSLSSVLIASGLPARCALNCDVK